MTRALVRSITMVLLLAVVLVVLAQPAAAAGHCDGDSIIAQVTDQCNDGTDTEGNTFSETIGATSPGVPIGDEDTQSETTDTLTITMTYENGSQVTITVPNETGTYERKGFTITIGERSDSTSPSSEREQPEEETSDNPEDAVAPSDEPDSDSAQGPSAIDATEFLNTLMNAGKGGPTGSAFIGGGGGNAGVPALSPTTDDPNDYVDS